MKTIFDQIELKHLHMENRLVRSATWEALAEADGGPSQKQLSVYKNLAEGGIGAIISGFTSVDENDNYFEGMARISNDSLTDRWRKLPEITHAQNVPVIMQLAMGEFVRNGRAVEPDGLSEEQIREIIDLFVNGAVRAENAGFDGVQIHAAHHFYLSRFISPAYNHRQDAYGGSTGGRARILTEILQGIRKEAPGLHITMKINCSDFMPGGLMPEEAMEICLLMDREGIDSIEISGNGTSVQGIRPGEDEGYFRPFARALKKCCDVPVILVGGHRSIECMNKILEEDGADLLSLSRPLIREPDLIKRWESGDRTPAKCVSCNACYRTPGHQCIFALRGM